MNESDKENITNEEEAVSVNETSDTLVEENTSTEEVVAEEAPTEEAPTDEAPAAEK